MAGEFQVVSLDTLMNGDILERFRHEFERVVENIADPNTTLDKRSVTITLTAKPNKSRTETDVTAKVVTKLAPTESMETTVFISMTRGGLVASEYKVMDQLLPGLAPLSQALEQTGTTVTSITALNGGR